MKNPRYTNDIGGIVVTQDDGADLYLDSGPVYDAVKAGAFGVVTAFVPHGPTQEEKAGAVRVKRNALLASSDWTQLPDVPTAIREPWAVYRQALRDITAQPSFPADTVWPVKPT
jgi:hypothetical protein